MRDEQSCGSLHTLQILVYAELVFNCTQKRSREDVSGRPRTATTIVCSKVPLLSAEHMLSFSNRLSAADDMADMRVWEQVLAKRRSPD